MEFPRKLPAAILAGLFAACIVAYYTTGGPAGSGGTPASAAQPLVDTSQLQTVLRLSPLAATPQEQVQARDAWRLADHELDLTFAEALRQAASEATAAFPSGSPLQQLSDKIARLNGRVAADKQRVADAGKTPAGALDLAQAQLDLDQDELDDAQDDLAREGGDKRSRLQQLLQEHNASDKVADQAIQFSSPAPTGTLGEQFNSWSALGQYDAQLRTAAQQATKHADALLAEHNKLESQVSSQPTAGATVAGLRELAAQHKTLSSLDQRIQDTRQLAAVYQAWSSLVGGRRRAVLRLILQSLAAILAILLIAVLLNGAIQHAFRQIDPRRLHQLRVIARIALQLAALLLILLILFGPPTQLSTIIGLVTAGITVVMKDFIVAFLGWFTLMGRNGVRVGDWVEIEGVSGEVIEIGLLKTVLLEMGNWNESGHPTGRRVAFLNSYAMEGHFFNFSTAGQWLWDELQFALPETSDPQGLARRIGEIVERETEADAAKAAEDWQRVTRRSMAHEFSAAPAVSLRPGGSGLDVVVRYITRAQERHAVKEKLFRAVVDLLHKPAEAAGG